MSIFKRLFGLSKPNVPLKIVLLGLDFAGKSSFVKYLQVGEISKTTRTMGFNVESVKKEGLEIDLLDIGGQGTFRTTLWPKFLERGADCILYIVDATDRDRLLVNEEEFGRLLNFPTIKGVPIVILANKQDLPDALSCGEVALGLKILELSNELRSFQVFPTSMKTGEGIDEVVSYLKSIAEKKK